MRAYRMLLPARCVVAAVIAAVLAIALLASDAAADRADSGAPPTDAGLAGAPFDDSHVEAWCQRRLLAPFRALSSLDEIGAWDELDPGAMSLDAAFEAQVDALWTHAEVALGTTAVVIALVPDPIDTGYVYQFYEASSAVELGIEQLGYLRDQVWLPWDDSHLQKKTSLPLDESCRLRVPGVLVLRDAAGPNEAPPGSRPRSVVALFVGETPTEGVHKGTLARAMALAGRIETWRAGHLRIVGPTYSGTADSLRSVLDAEDAPDASGAPVVRSTSIISGSATKSSIDSILTRVAGARDGGASVRAFQRTTLDNESTEVRFFRWLKGRSVGLGHLERVGLLVEEGTLFGREPSADSSKTLPSHEPAATPAVTLHFRRGIADLQRAHELQDANARAQATKTSPAPMVTPPSSVLDPSFDERTTPRDTAPDPSPKRLAALDLELRNLLAEVSREGLTYLAIRATDSGDAVFLAQQVHANAPDVRLIFMSSDVLLLHPAFAGDFRGSLVVSPYPFFGTSDLSNGGSSSLHDHLPWESQSSEGIFNAAIAVLAPDVPHLSNPPGKRDLLSLLAEYAPLSSAHGGAEGCAGDEPLLPLWVAVIGNGTVFPVDVLVPAASDPPASALFDPCEVDGTRAPGANASGGAKGAPREAWTLRIDETMSLPNGWTLLLLVFGLAGIAEDVMFRRSSERRAGDCRALTEGGGVRRPDLMLLYSTHLRYGAARSVAIALVFGYMTTVNFLALRSASFGSGVSPWRAPVVHGWIALTCLVTAALGAYALRRLILSIRVDSKIYVALDELRRWPDLAAPERAGLRQAMVDPAEAILRILRGDPPAVANARKLHALHASALYALVVVVMAVATWRAWFDLPAFLGGELRPTASGVAFVLRSLPLASGVSAAIVVVFLGVALLIWVAGRIQRAELTRGLSLITPDAGAAGGGAPALVSTPIAYVTSDAELEALEARVQNVLQRPVAFRCSLLRSGLIVILPVAAFFLKPPTTLETGGDTIALVILLCVITLIVGLTAQHLVEFWLALRALLEALRRWGRSSIFPLAAGYVGAPVSRLVTGRHKNVEIDELLICAEVARRVSGHDAVVTARRAIPSATDDQVVSGRDLGRALLELGRARCTAGAAGAGVARGTLMEAPAPDRASPKDEKGSDPLSPDAEYVACVLSLLLNRYVRHTRDFMTATSTPAVFIVLVLALYPFEPHRLMMTYAWVLTLSVVCAGVVVLLGMQRSAVLGALAGRSSGRMKVSRDSVVHFVAWVVIPLVSVFAAQYPEFGHMIGAIFDPISSAFR